MVQEIPMTRGVLVALVDDEDYDAVAPYRWRATTGHSTPYARTWMPETRTVVYLHHLLTGWPRVDHINRIGLDNRRRNLRQATAAQNSYNVGPGPRNTSGYKGVSPTDQGKWGASINVAGKKVWLGTYTTREAAALVYDAAAREEHGEFAWLNFPVSTTDQALTSQTLMVPA